MQQAFGQVVQNLTEAVQAIEAQIQRNQRRKNPISARGNSRDLIVGQTEMRQVLQM